MDSRIINSKRNIIFGVIKQLIMILLPFLNKTLILYILGAQYQGLSGLFASILQVLNLADLGFTTAVIYILYKPVASNDTEQICCIMNYFKNIYRKIGITILISGLLILPFLRFLIAGDVPNDVNIYFLYLLYLTNTVISYLLFGYKSALISAKQREDILSIIAICISLFVNIIQIILLLCFKNFYLYVVASIIGTILNNILLCHLSNKIYPDIKPYGTIDLDMHSELNKQVKALFINKIADVARNSLDNIILSTLFGLTVVAIYGNYFYIFSSIYGFMLVITHGIQASVGNSIVKESVEKNESDFYKFNFIFTWIIGFCSICLFDLYQPFMQIWMRNDMKLMLSFLNMTFFCIYFYFINITNVRNMYINANGLFWECRKWYIIEALGNLVLNLFLGYFIGISGILIATIITIILFNFIPRTNILYKNYFKKSPKKFYLSQFFYFIVTVFSAILCFLIYFQIKGKVNIYIVLLIMTLVSVVVPNIINLLFYNKTNIFKTSKKFLFFTFLEKKR